MKNFLNLISVFLLIFALTANADNKPSGLDAYNYRRGLESYNNKDMDEAMEFLNKETNENPQNGYAIALKAVIYNDKKEYGYALNEINAAIKYIPANDNVYQAKAYGLKGVLYLETGDTINGMKSIDKAIALDHSSTTSLETRAWIYYLQGKYDLSEKDYLTIKSIDESSNVPYTGIGHICLARKEYDKAIDYYSTCIKMYPELDDEYVYRAEAYLKKYDWTKAADDIITALSLTQNGDAFNLMCGENKEEFMRVMVAKLKVQQNKEPNDGSWSYNIGCAYESRSDYQKAIDNYKKAFELEDRCVCLERIAVCYEELGKPENALEYISMAQERDSTDIDLLQEKADILYNLGRTNEAKAEYERFIEKVPDNAFAYYRKGFVEDNAGMVNDAIEDYTMSISLDSTYFYAYLGRADQYVKNGMNLLAESDYRKVIELDTIPSTNSCAFYAYQALGEEDKAKLYMASCLTKFPDDSGVYYDAACLYSRMGETGNSIYYLKSALEKGYNNMAHIAMDDDMDNIRELPEFCKLIDEYKKKYSFSDGDAPDFSNYHEEVTVVPFTKNRGNECIVKCSINELPLSFTFDTGCSDISISQVEATFMMKNGYLSKKDVVGKAYYSDANGNVNEGTVLNLKHVNFGGIELSNIRASVVKNQKAPLLLGQSVFQKLGKIEIDNNKRELKITRKVK